MLRRWYRRSWRRFASDCPFLVSFGRFRLVLYPFLWENTVGRKKSKNKNLPAVGFFDAGAPPAHFHGWAFFFGSTCRKHNGEHNDGKIARNEKLEGAHWKRFLVFLAVALPDLPAVSGSSAAPFATIWPWVCSKSNSERIREFLSFLGGWKWLRRGGGRRSAPFSGDWFFFFGGGLAVRVWVRCEVRYLYPSPLNLGLSSRLKRKWIWTVHRV